MVTEHVSSGSDVDRNGNVEQAGKIEKGKQFQIHTPDSMPLHFLQDIKIKVR